MQKKLFIINGKPQSGKDETVLLFNSILANNFGVHDKTLNLSSIDKVREALTILGWDGKKDSRSRNALSALKDFSTEYNDGPYNYIVNSVLESNVPYIFAHIREPEEIKKLVESEKLKHISIKTIGVLRDIEVHQDNHADNNTNNYDYDIYIENYGTISDLRNEILNKLVTFDR